MSFLCRVAWLRLRDRVRSLDIQILRVEPLLLRIERSQLRWFRHPNLEGLPKGRLRTH